VTAEEEATLALQVRLTELGYWPGPIDGQFGPMTSHAVTAFQKVSGLPRTGLADDDTVAALVEATRPIPDADYEGFEVDLTRQVGFVVKNGRIVWVVDVSTGTSATPTPRGKFTVYREIDGNRVAPLGVLYRPKYFRGGFAIHGYGSVPSYPASHGCVRVLKPVMDMLWAEGHLDIGTPVTVHR
jgi:peptidoglycan hydrolase-like protein with peptidoglycan-binding domain